MKEYQHPTAFLERTLLSAAVGVDVGFDVHVDVDDDFDVHSRDQNQPQDQKQRGQDCPLDADYSAGTATAFTARIGQQALPNATAYTAAITPNPAARLMREAIHPTVNPSAT